MTDIIFKIRLKSVYAKTFFIQYSFIKRTVILYLKVSSLRNCKLTQQLRV